MSRTICILAALTALFITACGGGNGKNDPKTITFWHFWSEPNQKQALKELIEEFEKETGYKVEMTELSWNDGKTKLLAAFNSGTAPDALELGSDWVAQFSSSGALAELNTINLNNYIDFSRAPAKWQGKTFAGPWIVDTRIMFYNKDLLKAAGLPEESPKTFEELLTACEKVQNSGNEYGWGANGPDPHRLYKKILPLFWSNGGEVIDSTGKIKLASDANAQALEMYIALSRVGMIETQRQIDAAFTQGKIAFCNSGGWLIDKLKAENSKVRYGMALMPGMKGYPGISFAGGEYLAVSARSAKKEGAAALIKFLTDGKNSIKFCKKVMEAGFPADKNYINDSYFKSSPEKSLFAEQLKHSKMTPVHPLWLEMEAIIEESVTQALYGRMEPRGALINAQVEILKLTQPAQ